MKYLVAILAVFSIFLFSLDANASAAPFNAADQNPNVVAYYPTGIHSIVGENYTHEGQDLVMRVGNSGNFQQWFYGTSTENGGITEGEHSVWMNVGSQTLCPNGWDLVINAYPGWGDYLQPGANYCVHTNDFNSGGNPTP